MSDGLVGAPSSSGTRRLPLLDLAEFDKDQLALYTKIAAGPRAAERGRVPVTDNQGRLLGPFGIMLLAPQVGDAVQAVGAALRFRTAMTPRCRELAILAIASQLGSEFEWIAHVQAARAEGVTQDQLQALLDGGHPHELEVVEALTVATCRTLIVSRGLSDAEYAEVVDVFGTAGVAELVWLVGYYSSLALALEVFNPPLGKSDDDTAS